MPLLTEAVCHNSALIYDPTIQLNMQSANSEINQSLGLVRNVPCQIRTIMLYLQMHMIRDPAYDILLGRPFDILTESVVRNFRNMDQTITIKDPKNGTIITIPTMPRSFTRHRLHYHSSHQNNGLGINFQVLLRNRQRVKEKLP